VRCKTEAAKADHKAPTFAVSSNTHTHNTLVHWAKKKTNQRRYKTVSFSVNPSFGGQAKDNSAKDNSFRDLSSRLSRSDFAERLITSDEIFPVFVWLFA
jgi:hypothetical protein